VYWSNGSQIVSPVDVGVSAAIEKNQEPWPIDYASELKSPLLHDPTQDIIDNFFPAISREYSYHKDLNAKSQLKIVFTPMHGVGKDWVKMAFEVTIWALLVMICKAFHLKPYIPVLQQLEPDPEFPTVPFPNPEEGKGALVVT
jgi:phosphomannomutase